MMKRNILIFLLIACTIIMVACTGKGTATPTPGLDDAATPTPYEQFYTAAHRIGFIIVRSSAFEMYAAEYGFLKTAENFGYAAVLLEAHSTDECVAKVEEAASKGCESVVIWANNSSMYTDAVERAKAMGLKVIIPYYEYNDSAVINIVVDQTSYAQDAVKLMQSKLQTLYKTSGTIIIYGDDTKGIELYENALSGVSGYTITKMSRGGKAAETVKAELKDLLKTNRNIVAILCADSDGAPLWAEAANTAQSELKTEIQAATPTPGVKATPTPTPSPTPKPTPTPTPTPASSDSDTSTPTVKPTATPKPWITNPVIIAMDYTKNNISIINADDAYALIARPYFDASAQAVTIADKLMRGLSVPSDLTKMYVPVVTKNNIAKYEDILNEVTERFGYEEIAS